MSRVRATPVDCEPVTTLTALSLNQSIVDVIGLLSLEAAAEALVASDSYASGRTARRFIEQVVVVQSRRTGADHDAPLDQVTEADVELASSRLLRA